MHRLYELYVGVCTVVTLERTGMIRRCVKQLQFSVAVVEDLYCCCIQLGFASLYPNFTDDPTHHDGGRKIMTGISLLVLAARIWRLVPVPASSVDSLVCIVDLWFLMSCSVPVVYGPLFSGACSVSVYRRGS